MKFRLIHNAHYNTTIWYRVIESQQELNDHSEGYARWYWNTTWSDPHFEAALKSDDNTLAVARHPMNLLPKRATAMVFRLVECGAIYINKNGGWCVPTASDTTLGEIEADKWPDTEQSGKFQMVYISRWPLGNHYYLHSWPTVIQFAQEKYDTYEEAFNEAKRHVPENRIKLKDHPHDKFIYRTEGD